LTVSDDDVAMIIDDDEVTIKPVVVIIIPMKFMLILTFILTKLNRETRQLFLLSVNNWGGIVALAVVNCVVTGDVVGLKGGQAPLVNSTLSMAISLLQTPITASIRT